MTAKRVAVLRGGPSAEYEVSLLTGKGVIEALTNLGYFTKDIVIDRKGNWLNQGLIRKPEQLLIDVDVVFIAMHGTYGEDGAVQRLLEKLQVPYTGSGPLSSSIAFNKYLTKDHLTKHFDTERSTFKLAKQMRLTKEGLSDVSHTAHSITNLFGPHYIVKPVAGGSSIDTVLVENPIELSRAINQVLANNDEVLVEERIHGREATVGILENFRNYKYYVLPEVEIVPPPNSKFFAADVKYNGATSEIVPGRFSKSEKQALAEAAVLIHQALNLQQYSRADFIVANDGIYFLEVNTLPGLTAESLFPKSVDAVGSSYKDLVKHLVETATL